MPLWAYLCLIVILSPSCFHQCVITDRVANLPLVSSAYDMVSSAYASTKESHPYVKLVCDVAETGVKTIAAVAVSGAQPILDKLEPQSEYLFLPQGCMQKAGAVSSTEEHCSLFSSWKIRPGLLVSRCLPWNNVAWKSLRRY